MLAERIATEKPFIGYHAAVALLNAARSLSSSHRERVEKAIMRAQSHLNKRDWKDPNQVAVLRRAQQELKKSDKLSGRPPETDNLEPKPKPKNR